ncbi:sugar ABC transporter ATP-binding protein [Georgenia wutianyii]|uniref:Sugar ABC transporter ATP-binding protein n=1 Tax=Georgenia wutianyii TaxID=2585135 RepID=A0ABX5VN11_9MICO|nr:multiple monosaccharide ABC transporter ATP-binding protein [Georgenia wutianyii]QDB79894.1 sugar ABC transporter ATP-binding protein [Georgenia wutianyii]
MVTEPPILEMRSITKTFPGVKALTDVDLVVKRGEVHAIVGENGAGKSTLMNVLSGVYPHGSYDGEILFAGEPCEFRSIRDSEQRGIVIIHQELALSPYLSVAENIFLGNERSRVGVIDWNTTNSEAAKLMARVGLAAEPDDKIVDLGVGHQQLVEIAKALSKEVRLLILDEPTAALNDEDSAHLLQLMRQLKEQGMTMIMISHKLNEIGAIADSVTVLRDGSTIKTLDMHGPEPVTEDEIIRLMVGRELEHRYPERTPRIGEEVLRVEGWTVRHPIDQNRLVVDGASLDVRRGEVVGLAGLIGAGRTELAMSVFGRAYGTLVDGHLFVRGEEVKATTVAHAIRHGIAYASEDRKRFGLNLIQDVCRNVSVANLQALAQLGVIDQNKETAVADGYRRDLRIKTPTVQSIVGQLSGGNQQKVALSKWIYTGPEVLILDEPTRGIDVGAKYEIYQVINELAAAGKGVLVISSELPELLGICDRIYAMSEGRITGVVPREEATQERLMQLMTMDREGVSR